MHLAHRPDRASRSAGAAGAAVLVALVAVAIALVFWLTLGRVESPEADRPDGGGPAPDGVTVLAGGAYRVPDRVAYKLERLDPDGDAWPTEVASARAETQLAEIAAALADPTRIDEAWARGFATAEFRGEAEEGASRAVLRENSLEVARGGLGDALGAACEGPAGLARLLRTLAGRFAPGADLRVAFDVFSIEDHGADGFTTEGTYQAAGDSREGRRIQQNAVWRCDWTAGGVDPPRLSRLRVLEFEEVLGRAGGAKVFVDCTRAAIGSDPAYAAIIARGIPYWNARLDKGLGTSIFGHNGLAVADFDGDGFEDLYVCQPGGLPNLLFVHGSGGTAVNRAADAGVDFMDPTRSALGLDMDGDGDQDLIVAARSIVFLENDGAGHFQERFRLPADDTYSLAAADFDGDGDLDVFVSRYNQTDTSTPTPYYDANNGQPNLLLRNEGDWTFVDVACEVGLDANNRRYSFAASWVDYDLDGDPDLYVANDFGRNNLYKNEGGRFRDVAAEALVEDISAGMSVAWGDYDGDGDPDLYVGNMFSPEGSRITMQPDFHAGKPAGTPMHYERHARGNALFRNGGDDTFADVSVEARVTMGRWAWGSRFVDVDNDGLEDIVVANGYLSNSRTEALDGFFWRQVVALSPDDPAERSAEYIDGWAAVYELLRQGRSFAGWQRNCLFLNTGDGRFSDASAVAGFDHLDDGRGIAAMDWDRDGALDLWLTSRTAPRLRLLRNTGAAGNHFVAFLLESRGANRDAIGASVEVTTAGGARRLTRYLAAGDAFLSQSSKWLHFGLGSRGTVEAVTVTWPGGEREEFKGCEVDRRHRLVRGTGTAVPESPAVQDAPLAAADQEPEAWTLRADVRMAAPIPVVGLGYEGADRKSRALAPRAGRALFVVLWAPDCENSRAQLRALERDADELRSAAIDVLALAPAGANEPSASEEFLERIGWSHDRGFADQELTAVLGVLEEIVLGGTLERVSPTGYLIDAGGRLTALHRGLVEVATLRGDQPLAELTAAERRALASPFPGRWLEPPLPARVMALAGRLRRHGHLDVAAAYLASIVLRDGTAGSASDAPRARLADAHELLGRDLARLGRHAKAVLAFESCLAADPDRAPTYIDLGNSLRSLGREEEALAQFLEAVRADPEHSAARYSVGLVHAMAGRLAEAREQFELAVRYDPENARAQFNLGIAYANSEEYALAMEHLSSALVLDPDYLQARKTAGTILIHLRRHAEAIELFREGLRRHPRDADLLFGLGRALVATGDRDQAQTVQAELEELDEGQAARLASEIEQMP